MPVFKWQGVSPKGETLKGEMEATSREAVIIRLRTQRIQPKANTIREKGKGLDYQISLPAFGSPVSAKDVVIFTRQFATMIDAGLPIVQCLQILAAQAESPAFRKVIAEIKDDVESGTTLAEGIRKHPKVFGDLYSSMVSAGELGGILDTILQRLAQYIEKRVKLKQKVRAAMLYPSVVAGVAFMVLFVLLTWVIPAFEGMFADFGGQAALPAITRLVIGMSRGFVDNLIYIAIVVGAAIGGFIFSMRTPGGKTFWHRTMLTAPILGPVMRKIAVARFTRTLGTLLGSGVPILDAMTIVSKASGNVVVERAIMLTADRIREGRTMAEPLLETKVFPGMVVQMIGVGEQTGALDQMLNKIADFYEDEVDTAVAALTSLLEPLMMVVLGGMVGVVLIAMYLPIFDLAGKIKGD